MQISTLLATPPDSAEFAEYYGKYIKLVAGRNILETLTTQLDETASLMKGVAPERGDYRYEAGKWSIKEVMGHVNDTERIFAYRALRIARGDETPIEGFDQDGYVTRGPFSRLSLDAIVEEFALIRCATLALFRQLDEEAWMRRGTANKNEVSVRALAHIIAGHELHHRNILRERYLA